MADVTYAELRDRARSIADMRDSDFVTPTDWLRWANQEKNALDVFIARNGIILAEAREDFVAGTDIDQFGQATMNEPVAVLGVYEIDSGGYFRRLRSSDQMDGAGFRVFSSQVSNGPAEIYRVFQNSGGQITFEFYPIPTSGNYRAYIIPTAAPLALDADEVNYPMGWEERIVLGMAKRALTKEESPIAHIDALIREMDQRIEEAAWNRLFAANQRVRNVDKVERGWTSLPLIPTREYWYFV